MQQWKNKRGGETRQKYFICSESSSLEGKPPEARLIRWRRVKYGTQRSVVVDDCIQTPYVTRGKQYCFPLQPSTTSAPLQCGQKGYCDGKRSRSNRDSNRGITYSSSIRSHM